MLLAVLAVSLTDAQVVRRRPPTYYVPATGGGAGATYDSLAANADRGFSDSDTDESLDFTSGVVGDYDGGQGMIGFRFSVAITQGATIDSAFLTVKTYNNQTAAGDSFKISIYDVANCDAFAEAHTHQLYDHHTPYTTHIYWLDNTGDGTIVSPDLKTLIQQVISNESWASGNYLGLLLREDESGWAGKRVDFYSTETPFTAVTRPSLRIHYH